MDKPEVYFSVDIETDGPIPGPNSMLSLASVAFSEDGQELDSFTVNFETLPEASSDPDTMVWWKTQPEAWAAARVDPKDPKQAMESFITWVEHTTQKTSLPVFVAYPAGFDFLFVYWYLIRFVGHSPFSFSAIDIKTYVMAFLGKNYRQSTKRNMPKRWFKGQPKHTHVALDDARGQGMLFMKILKERRQ
jgi:DNA polymerase III alpha subunit (gram-positive type)